MRWRCWLGRHRAVEKCRCSSSVARRCAGLARGKQAGHSGAPLERIVGAGEARGLRVGAKRLSPGVTHQGLVLASVVVGLHEEERLTRKVTQVDGARTRCRSGGVAGERVGEQEARALVAHRFPFLEAFKVGRRCLLLWLLLLLLLLLLGHGLRRQRRRGMQRLMQNRMRGRRGNAGVR